MCHCACLAAIVFTSDSGLCVCLIRGRLAVDDDECCLLRAQAISALHSKVGIASFVVMLTSIDAVLVRV